MSVKGVSVEQKQVGDLVWHSPITLTLSPDMNPIAFNTVTELVGNATLTDRFLAELRLGDRLIWSIEFQGERPDVTTGSLEFTRKSSSMFSQLKVFSVTEAGDYQFDLKMLTDFHRTRNFKLKVRQNVAIELKKIYLPGFAVLVCWVLYMLISPSGKKRKTHKKPTH